MRHLVATLFLVAACGDGLPTAAPQDPDVLLQARTPGVTLDPESGYATTLTAGLYRVAWVTDGCTYFQVAWIPAGGDATPIEVDQASGEAFIELPAGPGALDRAADCDYTIRFEAAP